MRFAHETPPLDVLRADVARILRDTGDAVHATGSRRADVVFEDACVRRTCHLFESSTMIGRAVLHLTVLDTSTGRDLTSRHLVGEHAERPIQVTAESVEEALPGAYDEMLSEPAVVLVAQARRWSSNDA